ncbi:hypothetical protein ACSLBF_02615 [Pseudoalteromonas sp. T1lg65]|uniref:hypothetical protein n=1 Tax=Pseudoalteromonas sp. T1lg65 TaxID=2077101 RepID=UPI003F79ABEA
MLKNIFTLLALVTFTCSPARANTAVSALSLQQKVAHAIDQFEQTNRSDWAYTITRYENEEGDISQSVEQYNPQQPAGQQWSLMMVDGKVPTEKQRQAFMDKKAKQATEGKSLSIKLSKIINLTSLQLEEESQADLKVRFGVYLEKLGENASKKLTGLLTYNKENAFISDIEITNTDTFSPVLTANIKDFKMTLSFEKRDSAILPHKHEFEMRGSFAFFTEIDEVSSDTFSEYHYVGTQAE